LRRGEDVEDTDDIIVNINLATFSVGSLWLASSNIVYLEIGTPVLSVMSATLLRPALQRQVGRLHPGFCPYVPTLSTNQAGQIQDLIAKQLVAGGSPAGNVGHRLERDAWLQYTLISTSPLAYQVQDFETKAVTGAVVGLALVIAGIGGLFLTVVVIKAINIAVIEQVKAATLQKRVDKRENDGVELTGSSMPTAHVPTAIIPPLSLWASFAAWWSKRKTKTNLLSPWPVSSKACLMLLLQSEKLSTKLFSSIL
jgi:membrane protein implicated in regulation of membrane protease activity